MLRVESRTALSKCWWKWNMEESCLCVTWWRGSYHVSPASPPVSSNSLRRERSGRGQGGAGRSFFSYWDVRLQHHHLAFPRLRHRQLSHLTTISYPVNTMRQKRLTFRWIHLPSLSLTFYWRFISRKLLIQSLSWLLTTRRWGLVPLPRDLTADGVNLDFNCLKVSFHSLLMNISSEDKTIIPPASPRSYTFHVDLRTSLTHLGGREGASSDKNSDIKHLWGLRWVPWPQLPLAVTEDSEKS